MSRSLLAGLASIGGVDVWSLRDRVALAGLPDGVSIRAFDGSSTRFAAAGVAAALQPARLVVASHVQLAPVALPAAWRGSPLVIYLHGVEVWRPLSALQRAAVRQARRVLANSRFTVRTMEGFNGSLGNDAMVVPPGIPDRPRALRPGKQNVVLVVARMTVEDRYKGHDQLIELWPAVVEEMPDAQLVFVGDGDDRARLEEKARESGSGAHIEFTGVVDESRLHELYEEAGLIALPSRFEGFGLVIIEAMRAGRPVVAAPGAAEEIVERGVTGIIADPVDPAALKAAILSLMTSAARARAMGDAGRRRYEQYFTEARFHAKLAEVLSDVRSSAGSASVKAHVV